ncbi:fasciclin domain-containing protein [Christiangramia sediminis]|uniref:Fasciclin domain-containing protein n=1 Tax=Christiangramia sediminis TaxID=2881336 RepID=A0A9X1RYB1_9FLAO|nr:fasciclin domain-containing protein [Christiangramia sediminis]MCB7481564.1 fasciclin domain-containing protein [Christiangramia sediminis]
MKTSITLSKVLFKSLFLAFVFVFTSCEKEAVPEDIQAVDASTKASPASQKSDKSIVAIAEDDGRFTLLLAALEYTDLKDIFENGTDQYTVFAPTDDAFIALLGEDIDLNSLDPAFLANILTYHVTEGRRFSNSVLGKNNWKEIETLQGSNIYINSTGGIDTNDADMQVDSAILVEAGLFDIAASNGVIHVINKVLIPEE